MNPFILTAMGQIVSMLFFEKDGFSMKWPTKVDMLLKQETKPMRLTREFMQKTKERSFYI